MINQKESKHVRMDSWLLELLSKDKKKTKTNQQTIMKNNRKLNNNTKVKAMGNITPTADHHPEDGWVGNTDP